MFNHFLDINECERSPPVCPPTEDCQNTDKSYTCNCKDGYERKSENADCTGLLVYLERVQTFLKICKLS